MHINLSKQTKIVFILLLSLLVLLLVLKIFQPKQDTLPTITVTPTPTTEFTKVLPSSQPNQSPINQPAGEYNFRETIDSEIVKAYPLFYYIPYKTENWSVDYTNKMELTVLLEIDTPEIRQEVLSWITDRGVDPQSHQIIWKTKQ